MSVIDGEGQAEASNTLLDRYLYPLCRRPGNRVALVMGIDDYSQLTSLQNPSIDIALITEQLRWAGYEVISTVDLTEDGQTSEFDKNALERLIENFLDQAENADVAVIHYSGHGLQVDGENYIVPSDYDPAKERVPQLISVTALLTRATRKAKHTVVLLDACRDDGEPVDTGGDALRRVRSAGLANPDFVVRKTSKEYGGEADSFVIIKLAANPGEVAEDGKPGEGSPFSKAMAEHIAARGQTLGEFYKKVRSHVVGATKGNQHPWMSVGGDTRISINSPNWRERWLFVAAAMVLGATATYFRHNIEANCGTLLRTDSLVQPVYFLNSAWIASLLALAAMRWGKRSPSIAAGVFVIHFIMTNVSSLIYAKIYKVIAIARMPGGPLYPCVRVVDGPGETTYLLYYVLMLGSVAAIIYGLSFPLSGIFASKGMRKFETYVLILGPVVVSIGIIAIAMFMPRQSAVLVQWTAVSIGGLMHALFVWVTVGAYIATIPERVESKADT